MTKQTFMNVALVLRLALNATARACGQKRGFARRALDSTQDKSCSVALLGLAFTMAEILLSLTIIGVVAAITLPSLTGNINERTWNTQRKALYARMSQAISLMPALNGYGTLTETTDENGLKIVDEDTAAETFVTAGLSKVLKINNICDNEHLADCGLPDSLTTWAASGTIDFPTRISELNASWHSMDYSDLSGSFEFYQPDAGAVGFETQNGESIAAFYVQNCEYNMHETVQFYYYPKVCVNFIYDLNGTKGPNTIGKDMGFMSVLYPTDSVLVHPVPAKYTGTYYTPVEASKKCTVASEDYRLPNLEEGISMILNKGLLGTNIESGIITSSRVGNGKYWSIKSISRALAISADSTTSMTFCIKR